MHRLDPSAPDTIFLRRNVCSALLRLLAAAGTSACASGPAPTAWSTTAPIAQPVAAPQSPYTYRNEVFTATVTVLGIHAANARLEVRSAACDPTQPSDTVVLRSSADATGLAALLRSAHVEMETAVSVRTGTPVTNSSHFAVDPKPRDYNVRFEQGRYHYDYRRSDGLHLEEDVPVPGGEWAHDLHSGAILLRTWRPALGETAHVFGILGRHLWRVEMTFQGPDVLLRGQGARSAVRMDGVAEQLTGDERGVARKFQVWFSDDGDRIPLRLKLDSKWGEARLELVGYQQTTAPAGCTAGNDAGTTP